MTTQTGTLYWAYGQGIYYWSPHKNIAQSWTDEHSARQVMRDIKGDHSIISLEHCIDTQPAYWIIKMVSNPTTAPMTNNTTTPRSPKTAFAKGGRIKPQASTTEATRVPNPFADKQPKGDIADRIGSFAVKSFSPGGLINFGGIVFGSAAILNLGFWASVFTGMPCDRHIEKILMGDLGLLGLAAAGWLLSSGTTLFQTYPIVAKKSGESIAKQFLASLFRPDLTKLKGGEYELADAHNAINRDFWKFMGWAWFLCTAFEVMGGIIFVGPVFGQGLASLLSLLLFIYSIAGCQVGAFFIVMGQNMRLPKEGRGLVNRLERQAVSNAYNQLR